ncbi:PREDICTED: uncharacterized protein LOC104468911 [Pterocles gutturalis]|uniref:uncharacterized protein LOC104468911 n=1 Tax=Pterocles gutturalis TaxID=240206 RepID=UPI0005287573|nr:PREDICTED: uncharacterized protein LOC104468911 [Pterocles gutturalis]
MEEISIVSNLTAQSPGESKNRAENVVFLCSSVQALAGEKPPCDVGMQPSGKILSLDKQGAKKVLEIYVRRSLSCCETSLGAKEGGRRRGRKAGGLQRSKSDFCKYSCAKLGPRKDQEEGPKAPELDETLDDESKAPGEVPKEEMEPKKKSTKNSSQRKTQRTWFKSVLNFLLKKSPEEQKENTADVEQPDGYYARVSEEIGLIVQGSESQGSRARGRGEPPRPASADGVDEAIRRIVALLQSAGDELDRQLKEDAQLRTFFRDMSYSSFKNLADAYVRKEMTMASRPDVNPQEIQFAFAVHLTARVAGICNQAVNRIMGFGTRYLEDSFAPLSYSKILQDREKFSTDKCESPD